MKYRRVFAVVVVVIITLALGGTPGLYARENALNDFFNYDRPNTYQISTTPNVLVPMRDGYMLTCDLYRPANQDGTSAPGRFPGILINFTPYGRTNFFFGNDLRDFAAKGYNVMWCNTRGSQGVGGVSPAPNSLGPVNPFQSIEQRDDYDAIEWLATRSWSNGRIGQIGTSYGGIMTLLTAGIQQPPSLKAVIPIMGSYDLYRQFFYPGGIKVVGGDARGIWAANCSAETGEPTCSSRFPVEVDSHPTFDNFWESMVLDPKTITIPMLYLDGFNDFWVMTGDGLNESLGNKKNFSMILGPWPHSIPEGNPVFVQQYPISKGVYLAWFDKWLAGLRNVPDAPKVVAFEMPIAASSGWHSFESWPPRETKLNQFHLTANRMLEMQGYGNNNEDHWRQPGTNSYQVHQDSSSGTLVYVSSPLNEDLVIYGPVEVTLTAKFSATDGNLIVGLQDVAPDGSITLMGYAGYLKASHRESDSSPQPVVPGEYYKFNIQVPSKYWKLQAGHQLAVSVTSADSIAAQDALPGEVTILSGPHASYIWVHTSL